MRLFPIRQRHTRPQDIEACLPPTAVWFRSNRPLPAPAEYEQFCPLPAFGRLDSTGCDTLRSRSRIGEPAAASPVLYRRQSMMRKERMKRFLYALCALSFALPWSSAAFAEPVKIGFISPAAPPD